MMAKRYSLPDEDSSSSSGNEREYVAARLTRMQKYIERRGNDNNVSPGFSDEPLATPEQLEVARVRDEERANLFTTRMTTADWCKCGDKCVPVLFARSSFDLRCCQEIEEISTICQENNLFSDPNRYRCITEHPSFFNQCLYTTVIDKMKHLYSKAGHPGIQQRNNINASRRYVAYRQFTVWIHGRCGYKNRRSIPQCVTKRIKATFPSTNYTGFEEARETDSSQAEPEDDENVPD